jgi:O-antigen/teichoic acid export membrane protein
MALTGSSRVGRRARRNALAIVDQTIVSAAGLVTAVIMARVGGPDGLALFALALSIIILIAALQDALVSLPYTICGSGGGGRPRVEYTSCAFSWHATLAASAAACIAGIAAAASLGFGRASLAPALAVLATIAPFVLLRDFSRNTAVAHLRIVEALGFDTLVAILQVGAIAALAVTGLLGPVTAAVAIGAAAAIGGVSWLLAMRDRFRVGSGDTAGEWAWKWRAGRWVIASRLLENVNSDVLLLWLVWFLLGPTSAGLFAACVAVLSMANPLLLSVGLLVMPKAGRAYAMLGAAGVRRVIALAMLCVSAPLAALVALVEAAKAPAMGVIFDGRFSGTDDALVLLAITLPLASAGTVAGAGLLVLQRPGLKTLSSVFGVAALAVLAAALIPLFGVFGAACSLMGARLLETLLRVVMLSLAAEPDFARADFATGRLVTSA